MKVNFFINERFKEPEIRICSNKIDDELNSIKCFIDENVNFSIAAYDNGNIKMLHANEIYRIYSENQKTIAETEDKSFLIHRTLVETENILPQNQFVRISRSEIVNKNKIRRLDTSLSRTIQIHLKNGSVTYVSRRNVALIKKMLNV